MADLQVERPIINVECHIQPGDARDPSAIAQLVQTGLLQKIRSSPRSLDCNRSYSLADHSLDENHRVEVNLFTPSTTPGERCLLTPADCSGLRIQVHLLHDEDPVEEIDDESQSTLFQLLTLPHSKYQGLWPSLEFSEPVRERMLQYVRTAWWFSRQGLDPNTITSNRFILFHGPPGTGKTSLCRALAHKLAIALQPTYRQSFNVPPTPSTAPSLGTALDPDPQLSSSSLPQPVYLCEINSHSLFSKWFSESGKLVARAFARIRDLAAVGPVIVLIDEIESVAASRAHSAQGNEPSDAIRVVNAVLTELDKLRDWPQVLVLATSNMTEAIDSALLDRADVQQYIGPPSAEAIRRIVQSGIDELVRCHLVTDDESAPSEMTALSLTTLPLPLPSSHPACGYPRESDPRRVRLGAIVEQCVGFSGRTLRKLPVSAFANLVEHPPVSIGKFLDAMARAVQLEKTNRV